MKIGDLNSSALGNSSSQPVAPSSSRSAYGVDARRNYQSGPDQVYLSSASSIASSALSSHSARLTQLKGAVANGSYEPDSAEIGKALLSETLARRG